MSLFDVFCVSLFIFVAHAFFCLRRPGALFKKTAPLAPPQKLFIISSSPGEAPFFHYPNFPNPIFHYSNIPSFQTISTPFAILPGPHLWGDE